MDHNTFLKMKETCVSNGFSARGKAFFRVHGDGVLQVIHAAKERSIKTPLVSFGLFSMYDDLLPQWFTASGCIPRYTVLPFLEKNDSYLFYSEVQEKRSVKELFLEQVNALDSLVMPWLDQIDTQGKLAKALAYVERMRSIVSLKNTIESMQRSLGYATEEDLRNCQAKLVELECDEAYVVRWNDDLRYTPCLYSGDYSSAERIVQAILDQHESAYISNQSRMTAEEFERYMQRNRAEDALWYRKLEIAKTKDAAAAKAFFNENYTANCRYGKFALQKKD